MPSKVALLGAGRALLEKFCKANELTIPEVHLRGVKDWHVNACAYYRKSRIEICVIRCAGIGHAGQAWSYPGYQIDRTPYGVLQHELGHHADMSKSKKVKWYYGDYSEKIRAEVEEEKLTNYCPHDGEWFAEMFRLFVTNPDLLRHIRPKTYSRLYNDFLPVVEDSWDVVLKDAPERTKTMAAKRVKRALLSPDVPVSFIPATSP